MRLSLQLLLLALFLVPHSCSMLDSGGNGSGQCLDSACEALCTAEGKPFWSCASGSCVCSMEDPGRSDVNQTETIAGDGTPDDTVAPDTAIGDLLPDGTFSDNGPGTDNICDSLEPQCTLENLLERCATGEGCVEGICGPCQEADHCSEGSGCVDGTCGPCAEGEECREGEGCHQGTCGPCSKADHCPATQACVSGTCGPCSKAEQCMGALCISGECVACINNDQCKTQYASHFECIDNRCQPVTCESDGECMLVGQVCNPETFLCEPCESTLRCLDSMAYGAGFMCFDGVCAQGSCQSDNDCPVEVPVCGHDHVCRGCVSTAQGTHAECIGRFGAGWMCTAQGACVQGNCISTTDCGSVNKGLCSTASEAGQTIAGVVAAPFQCRPCVDHQEDSRCRIEYGLDDLICTGGKCDPGCNPDTPCGFKQVCGADRWCTSCADNTQCTAAYGASFSCVEGFCTEVQCDVDKPCLLGLVCDNYWCRECQEHQECPQGQVCDLGGTNTCKTGECTKATEQGLCPSHLCKANACVACSAENPCGEGRFCGADGVCYVGNCAVDQDCAAAPSTCREWKCLQGSADQRYCAEVITSGAPCDDANKCSKSTCQPNGTCLPYEYTCDDQLECTEDLCNPTTGACTNPVRPFRCLIDGQCYQSGDALTDEVTPFVCDPAKCSTVCTNQGLSVASCTPENHCVCSLPEAETPPKCQQDKCRYDTFTINGTCYDDWRCYMSVWYAGICMESTCQLSCAKMGLGWSGTCIYYDACECRPTIPAVCQEANCNQSCATAGWASGTCTSPYECKCTAAPSIDLRCKVCNPSAIQTDWYNEHSLCADENACSEDRCGEFGCYSLMNVANACSIDILGVSTCIANGAANPDNPCQVCDITKSKTSWSNRTSGYKCGFCAECNSAGQCLGVSGKDTSPPSCTACRQCAGANVCVNVPHGQDPKDDCGSPTAVGGCGKNGHCDGNGTCDIYGKDDSQGLVSDGNECTNPDYCSNGTISGDVVALPAHCGGEGGIGDLLFGSYSVCNIAGSCGSCCDALLICAANWAPCKEGHHCCSDGACKVCCDDSDCPSGKQCYNKLIINKMTRGCY